MNEKVKNALNWVLDRLSENSTWRGIVLTLAGLGIVLDPDQAAKFTAIGFGIVGVINIFRNGSPTKSQVAKALESKVDKPGPPSDVPKP